MWEQYKLAWKEALRNNDPDPAATGFLGIHFISAGLILAVCLTWFSPC